MPETPRGHKTSRQAILPFAKARQFARSLKLRSRAQWKRFCSGLSPSIGSLPKDVPPNPEEVYQSGGWAGWDDWLGTAAEPGPRLRPFKAARRFARTLGLTNAVEWIMYCNGEYKDKPPLPADIPVKPAQAYKDHGWLSFEDWLGLEGAATRLGKYRAFRDARRYVRNLHLESAGDWVRFCRGELTDKGARPDDIPPNPQDVYRNHGWIGFDDWLGLRRAREPLDPWRSFADARAFVRRLGLTGADDWAAWCKGELNGRPPKPGDIPANPAKVYRQHGWAGLADWLGVALPLHASHYRPFAEARQFARSLGLASTDQWPAYCQGEFPDKPHLPDDIPENPAAVYVLLGWSGFEDWLGVAGASGTRRPA